MVVTESVVPRWARTDGPRAPGIGSGVRVGAGGHSNERSNPASPRPDRLLRSSSVNPQSPHPDPTAVARDAVQSPAPGRAAEGLGHGGRTDGTRDR